MTLAKLIVIAAMNLLSNDALAGDDWLCTSQASQRRSNSILACGVATGQDEAAARAKAFTAAMDEFHRVCVNSIDCVNHEIQVLPQRTACDASGSSYKCYRLIQVYIGHNILPVRRTRTVVAQADTKLKVGMTKEQVVAVLGSPVSVYDTSTTRKMYGFKGDKCAGFMNDHLCHVHFTNNRAVRFSDVKSQYVEL